MTRHLRDLLRLAEALGVAQARIQHRGRHALLTGEAGGRRVRVFVPLSPSDWRAARNLKADMRRAAAGRQD